MNLTGCNKKYSSSFHFCFNAQKSNQIKVDDKVDTEEEEEEEEREDTREKEKEKSNV